MTAGEGVNEEAVEAAVRARHDAVQLAWDNGEMDPPNKRELMEVAFAAALPLLRPSDVPHVVTQVREQIAEEIEAAMVPVNWAPTFRNGMDLAARIARGSEAS